MSAAIASAATTTARRAKVGCITAPPCDADRQPPARLAAAPSGNLWRHHAQTAVLPRDLDHRRDAAAAPRPAHGLRRAVSARLGHGTGVRADGAWLRAETGRRLLQ